jgi:hypothetical protein
LAPLASTARGGRTSKGTSHGAITSRTLSVEYPRFGLSFDLERGQLRTKSSFLNTRLAPCQLLDDALIGFQKYLLLAHDDGVHVTLLVPEGNVTKDGDGAACVTVRGDDRCHVERRLHAYKVHPRLKMLQVNTHPLKTFRIDLTPPQLDTRPSVLAETLAGGTQLADSTDMP